MEKIAINPRRLKWCMNAVDVDTSLLAADLHIAFNTLEKAMESHAILSIRQLEKIANYFKRSLLFFLDPSDIKEEVIYSSQFRTINNQKPIHSTKLRAFIERVEKQRQIYLNLLENLETPVNSNWQPDFNWSMSNIKSISAIVRAWLELPIAYKFEDLRKAIEDKGIMVIVSNGYNGKWQIEKTNPVRGFSLYYEVLPIIVIKKQESKGAQAFTLMHELAHLLLHKESVIDEDMDFYSYQGKEKEANDFAGNLLIPDNFLEEINVSKLLTLVTTEYNSFFTGFRQKWCVSNEAILVRMLKNHQISQQHYDNYRDLQQNHIKESSPKDSIPRVYRHRESVNMFGRPFVYAVFDSLHNQKITLAKASTYLDNLKISDVHQLEQYV
jgi:Zn-dependent peptidase ImmA (M78 family)